LLFVASALMACAKEPVAPPAAPPAPVPPFVASGCEADNYVQARLAGAISAEFTWTGQAFSCESMRRPDSEGVRLRFTGQVSGERLAFILAIPELDAGETNSFDTVVTITVEGSGRFFSTANLGTCFTDVVRNEAVGDAGGDHIVEGTLSCVGPLGEINGDGYADLQEMRFSGIANWENS
jgi:hypothetical protein